MYQHLIDLTVIMDKILNMMDEMVDVDDRFVIENIQETREQLNTRRADMITDMYKSKMEIQMEEFKETLRS